MAEQTTVRTVCPRDCYDGCGMLVEAAGGAVTRVAGDPAHPVNRGTLCGKCMHGYNGAWIDAAARMTHPLRRVGRKGSGEFERVSWDEALTEIAGRLHAILAAHPPSSILHTHYTGTCSLIAGSFPMRFFHRLGATEVDPDTVCNKAGHVALGLMFGDSCLGFDPRTAAAARCIVIWGMNPSASAPHAHQHWLRESGAAVVVVDPIRHDTARLADHHLQLRPGSDAALAFALLHVLAREGHIDREFIARHTLGFETVERSIAEATPEWGAARTGVPADLIVAAARCYGRGPALLWLGQGLQRQRFGASVMRAVSLLPVATGNIGRPGSGFLYLNGGDLRGLRGDYLAAPHLARQTPPAVSHMDLAPTLERPDRARALFTWNNNIAASSPEQSRLHRALAREDLLHVAIDLFQTDTVDFADYVLPAASFLEFDDIVMPPFRSMVSAQCRVVPAMGEALPNQEIFRRLARAMDYAEPELFESDAAMLDTLVRDTGIAEDFAGLAALGSVDWPAQPYVQFEGLAFPTPSGRVELAGERFVAAGLTRAPEPVVEALPDDGALRLLSPASKWLMNSSFGNEPLIAKRFGVPSAWLHPDDARARNVVDDDLVELVNDTGRIEARAELSTDVVPGVVMMVKSSWPKLAQGRVNVNVLFDGARTDAGASSAVHSITVRLRRLDRPQADAPAQ